MRRGFDALDLELVGRGWAGKELGRYDEPCYPADKVARFLFEFHAAEYQALELSAIPSTASSGGTLCKISNLLICVILMFMSKLREYTLNSGTCAVGH
jgi:hypothetical protein